MDSLIQDHQTRDQPQHPWPPPARIGLDPGRETIQIKDHKRKYACDLFNLGRIEYDWQVYRVKESRNEGGEITPQLPKENHDKKTSNCV
jgi:hypothetical protein